MSVKRVIGEYMYMLCAREVVVNIHLYLYILTLVDENTCNMFLKNVFYELMCNS